MNRFRWAAAALALLLALIDPALASPLHDAARKGDLANMKLLMDAGADVNERDDMNHTPLSLAAKKSARAAMLLLSRGAKPDPADLEFLLGQAVKEGNIEVINAVLKRGVDVNARPFVPYDEQDSDAGGEPAPGALDIAVDGGKLNIMDLLVKHGATIRRDHLFAATCAHQLKVLQWLVDHGAALDGPVVANAAVCGDRNTLTYLMGQAHTLDYAAMSSHLVSVPAEVSPELFETLFARDDNFKAHATPLLAAACAAGNTQLATLLYDRGVEMAAESATGTLQNAARGGQAEMVELLLKHGAKVDVRTEWGNTPLLLAAPSGNAAVAALLLKHGADVNAKNQLFNTALHMAAARDHAELGALLLDNGARINAINGDGNSPLHQAARFPDKFTMLQLLVARKANVNIKNKRGMTPLHYLAIRNTDYKDFEDPSARTYHYLSEELAPWQAPYPGSAGDEDRMNAVRLLVSNGADLNAKNQRGESPLDLERKYSKNPEFVRYLEKQANAAKP